MALSLPDASGTFGRHAISLLGEKSPQIFEKWSEVDPDFARRLPAIALSLGLVREALAFDLWQMAKSNTHPFSLRALSSAIEFGESDLIHDIFALVDAEGLASTDDNLSVASILADEGRSEAACSLLRRSTVRSAAWHILWVKALLGAGAPEAGDMLLALLTSSNPAIHKNLPSVLHMAESVGLLSDRDYFVPNLLEHSDPSYLQVILGAVLNSGSFPAVKERTIDLLADIIDGNDILLWRALLRDAHREDSRNAVGSLNAIYSAAGMGGVAFNPGEGNALAHLSSTPTYCSNTGPLVSVVICSFDAQDTISYALSSIARQSHTALEIIVIDDHSSQPLVLDPAWSHGREVRLHRNKNNLGPYLSRNAGIAMAKGELIAFHDADDWSHPDKISHQLSEMKANNALAHYGSHIRLSFDGTIRAENNGGLLGHGPITGIMRREVFRDCGEFLNTRTRGDIEFRRRIEAKLGISSVLANNIPYVLALDWNSNSKQLTKSTQQRRALKHFLRRAHAMQRVLGFSVDPGKIHCLLDSLAGPPPPP